MSDDHERDTLTPDPREERHASPPPPWERGTTPGRPVGAQTEPAPGSFGKTQPIKQPTVEDVLEVFGHFQKHLLTQIDERDERILLAIQDIGADIVAYYQRETKRGDEHTLQIKHHDVAIKEQATQIKRLRERTHKHSTVQQATEIRLAVIEQRLGIESPEMPTPSEEVPEPT